MPKPTRDPENVRKGDGMAAALRIGKEKKKPNKGKQPGLRSDGMKIAAKGEDMRRSKVQSSAGARKKER
jgi:hypothetical protein